MYDVNNLARFKKRSMFPLKFAGGGGGGRAGESKKDRDLK